MTTKSNNVLIEYIHENDRDIFERRKSYIENRGPKIGVVVATLNNKGEPAIGFSKVNLRSKDVFNKETGINIALGRAKKSDSGYKQNAPANIAFAIEHMAKRAVNYFKRDIIAPKVNKF